MEQKLDQYYSRGRSIDEAAGGSLLYDYYLNGDIGFDKPS